MNGFFLGVTFPTVCTNLKTRLGLSDCGLRINFHCWYMLTLTTLNPGLGTWNKSFLFSLPNLAFEIHVLSFDKDIFRSLLRRF